jgi:4-hydroxy-2-oxoheptanedioate aldolase
VRVNRVKKDLKEGKLAVGALLPFYSPAAVEILGYSGCDFVILDSEHGPLTLTEIENMVRAADCVSVVPLVRVESNVESLILRVLDTGVLGVQIPHVSTRMDAESAVRAVKYYPLGERGLANSVRAAGYTSISAQEYVRQSNDNSLVTIQVEDIKAVANLEDILNVEGIDVVFIGQNDLAQSMGFTGQSSHPKVQKVVDKVLSMTLEKGLSVGISTNVEDSQKWIKLGAKFISLSFVPTMLKSWKGVFKEIRGHE